MTEQQRFDWDVIEAAKQARENRWAELFAGEEPSSGHSLCGIGSSHPSTPRSRRQYDGRAAD